MACAHGKLKNPVGRRVCKKAPKKAKGGRPTSRCTGGYAEPVQTTSVRCWCPKVGKDGRELRRRIRCPRHLTAAGRRAGVEEARAERLRPISSEAARAIEEIQRPMDGAIGRFGQRHRRSW